MYGDSQNIVWCHGTRVDVNTVNPLITDPLKYGPPYTTDEPHAPD